MHWNTILHIPPLNINEKCKLLLRKRKDLIVMFEAFFFTSPYTHTTLWMYCLIFFKFLFFFHSFLFHRKHFKIAFMHLFELYRTYSTFPQQKTKSITHSHSFTSSIAILILIFIQPPTLILILALAVNTFSRFKNSNLKFLIQMKVL